MEALGPILEVMAVTELSERQEEVASLFGQGFNHDDVCRILNIKQNTLHNYITIINLKWGSKNRTQIAIMAWEKGLVK